MTMNSKEVLFSIIIPTYNCAEYIQQTLRSIYAQTEHDYEIIIIDDGSTDNLLEILAQETDSRLRVITQPNSGVSEARNRGIAEAKGKYIAFLDADDAWLSCHLARARAFFEKYPQFHWYATKPKFVRDINDETLTSNDADEYAFYESNWFLELAPIPLASSTVIRRESASIHLSFPVGMKMFEDNVGWSRFALHYPIIGTSDKPTALYYQRLNSATQNNNNEWKRSLITHNGLEDLLEQQKMMTFSNCPKEAKIYFRLRSLNNWITHLQRIKAYVKLLKFEIPQRRTISGFLPTFVMSCFRHAMRIATDRAKRIIEKKQRRHRRKLRKMLKTAKKKLT